MDRLIEGFARFRNEVLPQQHPLYKKLAWEGQTPSTLAISCSDSRVMPEILTQCDPGEMFVTRNAGNIVPPHGTEAAGAVTSAIEYAVKGLGVRHIVVCGHTDCGAMKALLKPESLETMPAVAAWLGHCSCVRDKFVCDSGTSNPEAARHLAMDNVTAQLENLETHPCVAAGLAAGELTLHGWLFDIDAGQLLTMDRHTGVFAPIDAARAGQGARPAHLVAAE